MDFDDKERMMLSKSLEDINNMLKFMEEFVGQNHAMILELYNQTGIELHKSFREYKFKNTNPWGSCETEGDND